LSWIGGTAQRPLAVAGQISMVVKVPEERRSWRRALDSDQQTETGWWRVSDVELSGTGTRKDLEDSGWSSPFERATGSGPRPSPWSVDLAG
jgi:hypothetical protein